MASELDCFNDALGQLGHVRITSLDDTSNALVQKIQTFRHTLRRAALEGHSWGFATAWTPLAQDADAPAAKWAYHYTLPGNALRVWRLDEYDTTPWEVVYKPNSGVKAIATNATAVIAEITYDVTNADIWSPAFYLAMTTAYASKLAPAVIGGELGLRVQEQKYAMAYGDGSGMSGLFADARAIDGQQQGPQRLMHTEFVTCRG